ncbi:MAG: hypothetical protein ACYST0_10985, partial [Planctomycetota bacterium]
MTMRPEILPLLFSAVVLCGVAAALMLACATQPPARAADIDALDAVRAEQARLRQQLEQLRYEIAGRPVLADPSGEPQSKLIPEQRQQKVRELRAQAMDGTQMDILRVV